MGTHQLVNTAEVVYIRQAVGAMGNKCILLLLFAHLFPPPAQCQVGHPSFQYLTSDSVLTHASDRYKAHSFLRYIFMGKNYRKTWEQPVTLPVFHLSKTGFKIIELGGGLQTKSLKLEDSTGKAWALRTVDKDVSGAMPKWAKGNFLQDFSQDRISASMPYGVLVIGPLAKQANVRAAQPLIYFVADDTALGSYRSTFANTVCMLEERDPGFATTVVTDTVFQHMQQTNNCLVDQRTLLRARLFDMLIADWDRHYDNWRWGLVDSGDAQYYLAIPRDRDWAFYRSGGLVPKLVSLSALRFLVNFTEKPKRIKNLSAKAQTFDRVFLNGLDADDWRNTIRELQKSLTDETIESAVKALPPAIFALNGAAFIRTLKSRRDRLENAALKYYRFLSKDVQVDGSNEPETFLLSPAEGGFWLQVYRRNDDGGKGPKMFGR